MVTSIDTLSAMLAELRQILEEERSVLLSGSPERIAGVVDRKLALADMIEKESEKPGALPPSVETLSRLARYNRENSVICSALLRHLTDTVDKLRQRDLHRSYGPDGTETSPSAQNPLGAA
jgi:flagellar biosynthesis/type III secretory pathway chaperone